MQHAAQRGRRAWLPSLAAAAQVPHVYTYTLLVLGLVPLNMQP